MATLSLLPNYIMRQFNNDGKMLSGGKIYFYQSGTNTPKTVYQDVSGTIPHTNPVILDASGSETIFLGSGAYRIKVTDLNDVQVDSPVDGIIGSSLGGVAYDSTANTTLLQTYAELRALSTTPDLVYVAGRTTEGDGGQGWFQYIPSATDLDDDAIILTSQTGSKVYKRIFDGVIDPRWSGLVYSVSIDQASNFNKNTALSVKYGLPVLYTASTYINQNVTIPDNSTVQMADNAVFISTLSVTMTFASGSVFLGSDRCFGQSVSPKFNNTIEEIKLSWMAGNTADERMDKLLLSTTNKDMIVVIDESVSIAASTWVFPNVLRFVNGSIITFTGSSSLDVTANYIEPKAIKMFQISSTGSKIFTFGNQYIYPEMLGAVADGVADDYLLLSYSAGTKYVRLSNNKTYLANSPVSFGDTEIIGSGTIKFGSLASFSGTNLRLYGVKVSKSHSSSWSSVTNITAVDCELPGLLYTYTTKNISNCKYTSDTRYPVLDGSVGPSLYNPHVPLLSAVGVLTTDTNGKIISKNGSRYVYNGALWECVGGLGNVGSQLTRIRFVNGKYWALGSSGYLANSLDGITWTKITFPNTTWRLQDIVWNGTYYIVSGCLQGSGSDDYGTYRSTDGIVWVGGNIYNAGWPQSFVNNQVHNIGYNGATVVLGASGGYCLVSYDHGATFNPVRMAVNSAYSGSAWIGYIGNKWVVGDDFGNWYYSTTLANLGFVQVGSNASAGNRLLYMTYTSSRYKCMFASGWMVSFSSLDRTDEQGEWSPTPQGPNVFNDAYGDSGVYIVVGSSGMLTSYDGIKGWTPRTITNITFGNDFVGNSGTGCGGGNGKLFLVSDRYIFQSL